MLAYSNASVYYYFTMIQPHSEVFKAIIDAIDENKIEQPGFSIDEITNSEYGFVAARSLADIALKHGWWNMAEQAYLSPEASGPEGLYDRDQVFRTLGDGTLNHGEFDRARGYYDQSETMSDADKESRITRGYINHGMLDEAEISLRNVDFAFKKHSIEDTHNFRRLIDRKAASEQGVVSALGVLDEMMQRPNVDDFEDDFSARQVLAEYDFVIERLAPLAIQQKEYAAAAEVVGRMHDWYIGAASGGGGLLECALESKDPNVIAATWTLIYATWGNGSAHSELPRLSASVDAKTKAQINEWLTGTDLAFRYDV